MAKINREDIHLISKHSNLSEVTADKNLKENVYNTSASWKKFLQLLFISLGIAFTTSGIIFFFAYNWDHLDKFIKIGLIEGVIVIATLIVLLSKLKPNVKNIILLGTGVLIGVLFAVFGQIYQTGANAYDFFLGWTAFITLWVVVSNFAPLWFIYLILINTTLFLYSEQVANWSFVFLYTLLFTLNAFVVIVSIALSTYRTAFNIPNWFLTIIALAVVFFATIGMISGIFEYNRNFSFIELIIITVIVYSVGIKFSIYAKKVFYISIIAFSLIAIFSALFIKISDDAGMFLLVSIFITVSLTLVVKYLIELQKKWTNE